MVLRLQNSLPFNALFFNKIGVGGLWAMNRDGKYLLPHGLLKSETVRQQYRFSKLPDKVEFTVAENLEYKTHQNVLKNNMTFL